MDPITGHMWPGQIYMTSPRVGQLRAVPHPDESKPDVWEVYDYFPDLTGERHLALVLARLPCRGVRVSWSAPGRYSASRQTMHDGVVLLVTPNGIGWQPYDGNPDYGDTPCKR